MTKEFPNTGNDFSGFDAACKWLTASGYSYGSMQRDASIGILYGDFHISKWRHLSQSERDELDGTITFRGGPRFGVAIVNIKEADDATE